MDFVFTFLRQHSASTKLRAPTRIFRGSRRTARLSRARGGYAHATTCALNRNGNPKSRVSVFAPAGFLRARIRRRRPLRLRGSRFLRPPPERLLFLGLRFWGLNSRIIQNFSFRLQPILFCIPAVCSPRLLSVDIALTRNRAATRLRVTHQQLSERIIFWWAHKDSNLGPAD
jgi:hypothetical protein